MEITPRRFVLIGQKLYFWIGLGFLNKTTALNFLLPNKLIDKMPIVGAYI